MKSILASVLVSLRKSNLSEETARRSYGWSTLESDQYFYFRDCQAQNAIPRFIARPIGFCGHGRFVLCTRPASNECRARSEVGGGRLSGSQVKTHCGFFIR